VKTRNWCDLERKGEHQPAEYDRTNDETAEEHGAEAELLVKIVAHQRREDGRDEEREDDEKREVAVHAITCAR
jgi:hypothetical protein